MVALAFYIFAFFLSLLDQVGVIESYADSRFVSTHLNMTNESYNEKIY